MDGNRTPPGTAQHRPTDGLKVGPGRPGGSRRGVPGAVRERAAVRVGPASSGRFPLVAVAVGEALERALTDPESRLQPHVQLAPVIPELDGSVESVCSIASRWRWSPVTLTPTTTFQEAGGCRNLNRARFSSFSCQFGCQPLRHAVRYRGDTRRSW